MRLRTVLILMVALLCGSLGMRFLVVRYSLLPISEEAVLRCAVAVTVDYQVGGVPKKLRIDDPAELKELLWTLRIRGEDYRYGHMQPTGFGTPGNIQFHFPNGSVESLELSRRDILGRFTIDSAFHDELYNLLSRREKKKVELIAFPFVPQGAQAPAGFGGNVEDKDDNFQK